MPGAGGPVKDGKDLVAMMLNGANFKVVDLWANVAADKSDDFADIAIPDYGK